MRVVGLAVGLWLCAGAARADLAALPCSSTDALSEAAALLMLQGTTPTPQALSAAAKEAGFHGAQLHASLATDDAALSRWLRAMRGRERSELLCGEAVTAERRLVVAAPFGGELSFEHGRLVGKLGPGFASPELVIQGADGKPQRLPVQAKALKDGVPLPGGLELPAQVQLVAEGPAGPRPVAEVEIESPRRGGFTTAPAPGTKTAPRRAPARKDDGGPPGPALHSRLAAFRRAHDAPSLRDNALLERSATRHAAAVCASGHVAHRLSDGEDPVSRLRRERIEARAVGEAIGRSRDAAGALEAIFDSPSHRYAVVERSFTDVGIGHARDARGRSCVVVLLAAWPRRIP